MTRATVRVSNHKSGFRLRLRWARLRRWEFWPWRVFYTPVVCYWLVLSGRARSLTFFTAANPRIANGGFLAYSKWDVLRHLPESLRPRTFAFRPDHFSPAEVRNAMEERGFQFPVILKPDVGERGTGVARIDNDGDLQRYLAAIESSSLTLLLQTFVNLPLEFGVMYHRYPGQRHGQITSVVQKQTLTLRGDGRRTLAQLVRDHPRAWLYHDYFCRSLADRWEDVPPAQTAVPLGDLGNHCRGATFLDANDLIDESLTRTFDRISRYVPDFHFGRYDVKVASVDDLRAGRVQVLELNGVNSEPAHIYDPDMPLMRAYAHLFRHWRTLYWISRENHRRGIPYVPAAVLYRHLRAHLRGERPLTPAHPPTPFAAHAV